MCRASWPLFVPLLLLPAASPAQDTAVPAVPVNRWIRSDSASGIRSSDGGFELRRGKGWIFTAMLFADFTLDIEFRIVDEKSHARLFVRAYPGALPGAGSYSVHLSDAVDGASALGAIGAGIRDTSATIDARRTAIRPRGEWQRLEVTCDGRSLRVKLNGTDVDRIDDVVPEEGVLGLAADTGRLEVRSLRVREHGPPATSDLVADLQRDLFDLSDKSIKAPKLTRDAKPNYTASAMTRRIQGAVWLKAVVAKDGSVGDVRVTRTLDRELDREAIATLKKWRFAPAQRDGVPVDVIIEVEMSFTLR